MRSLRFNVSFAFFFSVFAVLAVFAVFAVLAVLAVFAVSLCSLVDRCSIADWRDPMNSTLVRSARNERQPLYAAVMANDVLALANLINRDASTLQQR
jgi:hypothetical protein